MAEDKPLIAGETPATGTLGGGVVDSVVTVGQDMVDGDWAEGLVNGVAAASSLGTALADPLAALGAAGAGWAIEHFSFLKEPLDALAGDQQAIEAMSTTWANVGQEVQGAADDLRTAVQRDTDSWSGEASDSYRSFAEDKVSTYAGLAGACTAVGTAVKLCGTVLSVVRDIVRDLISQAVGELVAAIVEWAAAECVSVGLATPGMVADLTRRALKWADKISEWTKRFTEAVKNLYTKLGKFGELLKKLKDFLEKPFSQSPLGQNNTLKRAKRGLDGHYKTASEVHIDNPTTAGNKAIGKTKTEAAKALQGDFIPAPSKSEPDDDRPTGNREHY